MKLCFLLAKDPTSEEVGDTAMMNQLLELVRSDHDVSIICWSTRPTGTPTESSDWPSPRSRPCAWPRGPCGVDGACCTPATTTRHCARPSSGPTPTHSSPFTTTSLSRSCGPRARAAPLYVVNVVPESPVWRETRGWLGRMQARAIERDEARVIRQATSVGSYDKADAAEAAAIGARRSVWLELTLPPRAAMDVRSTPPRLAVLGDRTWAPNERAWQRMLALWPEISAGVPDAELVAIGHPSGLGASALPPGRDRSRLRRRPARRRWPPAARWLRRSTSAAVFA